MSADLLREAAALMRQRADLPYVTGAWEANGHYIRKTSGSPRIGFPAHAEASCCLYEAEDEKAVNEAIAEHIASWDTSVALAVADALDATADHLASYACEAECEPRGCQQALTNIKVARAYLGRSG